MNITYNISFAISGLIIAIIVFIIVCLNYSKTSIANKRFKVFLVSVMLMIGLDILTVITNDNPTLINYHINIVLNSFYFLFSSLVAILFLSYCVLVAIPNFKEEKKRAFYIINYGFLGVYVISLIVNAFIGFYFYYDINHVYTSGPLYLLVNLISLLYLIECIVIFCIYHKSFTVRQMICTALFFAIFFVTFGLQLFVFKKVLLSDFGVALGSLMVFFSIETPDYIKLVNVLKEIDSLNEKLEDEIASRTNDLYLEEQSYKALTKDVLSSVALVIDSKDYYTKGHSFRVAAYAKELATYCNFEEIDAEKLYYAGLIHDLGKMSVSEKILTKPGLLTKEEFEVVKKHSQIGADIVKGIPKFQIFEDVTRYHHERYDGMGYPKGLKGTSIPMSARIIAVCDAFDAMVSDRSYRKAMPYYKALEELEKCKGTQFDSNVVDNFISLSKKYDDSNIVSHINEIASYEIYDAERKKYQ